MSELEKYNEKPFESIKHIDECGMEFWSARELMDVLEYERWENFHKVILKAKFNCFNSNIVVSEHFRDITKVLLVGNNSAMEVLDFELTRYACYLVVQNSDPRKKAVALGKTYFAIQTRKQELTEDEYNQLTEGEKRLKVRKEVADKNKLLSGVAKEAGVQNYGTFNNAGYVGLYNGETMQDIKKESN